MDKLEWSTLEYEEKERSKDWFWALGIIIVTSSIAAIIFENYFFATLLFISGLLLGFFAIKKPDTIQCELNIKGLKIGMQFYPYKNIKSFWIQTHSDENISKPILFIKSERMFIPVVSVNIDKDIMNSIRSILLSKEIPEEEMKEHPSVKIMEYLGF